MKTVAWSHRGRKIAGTGGNSTRSFYITLTDLGFFRAGDFGNPSERSERALRGPGLTGERNLSVCRPDLARGGAQHDIEIT